MGRRKSIRDTSGNGMGKKGKPGNDPISGTPESPRRRRIVSLRNQLADGTYRVDPEAVAEKMVQDAVRKIRSRIRPQ